MHIIAWYIEGAQYALTIINIIMQINVNDVYPYNFFRKIILIRLHLDFDSNLALSSKDTYEIITI